MPFLKLSLWAPRRESGNAHFVQPEEGEQCKKLPESSNVQMKAKTMQLIMTADTAALLILRMFKDIFQNAHDLRLKIGLN